ncbi:MAG: serine/threonine-protein kinase, partial [Gemmatimonadota bacterium]|nr:serine/threonine-protein kinase [Gemmatimonadota bacterium]
MPDSRSPQQAAVPAALANALADRYRLQRELGQGGMATVYLADDLKHDRKVAIKVLRPELAAVIGAERFLSEIKTTANLQHPHILPLHDSGEADSFLFYVMPYVEGESLRDRLLRDKQLPVTDAVRIASEVASALDYAHRRGIIHRDIKPENILLHDGSAMVADFGIALAASRAGGSRMTETGMSLGTPQYMSPEQAMGERELDARSDIYALGAMTYEMLTGEPPFSGPTAQAIVAKVMTGTPEQVTALRRTVPPNVAAAVHQALEKLPADRFAAAADFAAALGNPGFAAGLTVSGTSRRGAERSSAPTRTVLIAAVVLTLLSLTLAAWAFTRGGKSGAPVVYDAALPDSAPMAFGARTVATAYGNLIRSISVSTGGDFAVYAAGRGDSTELWYRSLRDATARPLPGTQGATAPRISPDGSRVAFLVADQVMVVSLSGGEVRRLLEGQSVVGLNWTSATEVQAADLDGYRLTWLDAEGGNTRSQRIPRCTFAYWVAEIGKTVCSFGRIATLLDIESGERMTVRSILPDGTPGSPVTGTAFRVVDRNYLVYLSLDGSVQAARFDPVTALAGRSVTLTDGVRRDAIGEAQYDIAANGTLVFGPGVDATVGRLVSLRPGGAPEELRMEAADFQRYDLSPDRRWMAAVVQAAAGTELRIYDLRDRQQFTWLRGELIRQPLWSTTGQELLIAVRDSSQWAILRGEPSSGRAPDTLALLPATPTTPDPIDFHDPRSALAADWEGSVIFRFDPSVTPSRFDTLLTGARFSAVSPNGKHVAYQGMDGSRIVVTSYPVAGRISQLASRGVEPFWLSDSEVLYRLGITWYVVRINPATGEPLGPPAFWARDPRFSDTSGWSNRPSRDGGIIYVQGPEQTSASYLR